MEYDLRYSENPEGFMYHEDPNAFRYRPLPDQRPENYKNMEIRKK